MEIVNQLENLKSMRRIRDSASLRVTGWGTCGGFLFILMHDKLDLPGIWLSRIDSLLALCAMLFFMKMVQHVDLPEYAKNLPAPSSGMRKALNMTIAIATVLVFMALGIYMISLGEKDSVIRMSATVLGLILITLSMELSGIVAKTGFGKALSIWRS